MRKLVYVLEWSPPNEKDRTAEFTVGTNAIAAARQLVLAGCEGVMIHIVKRHNPGDNPAENMGWPFDAEDGCNA